MIPWIVLGALATYYLALSVTSQEGPFQLFERVRERLSEGWIGRGMRCIICVSCYTALVIALMIVLSGRAGWYDIPVLWFGLAGGSVLIDKFWKPR